MYFQKINNTILNQLRTYVKADVEGLILKLKLQYFGHLIQRTDSFEKTLMLGKIEGGSGRGDRGWDGWMVSPTQWTWVWVNSGSWWWTGRPGVLQSMGSQRVRHDWATELNWNQLNHQLEDHNQYLQNLLTEVSRILTSTILNDLKSTWKMPFWRRSETILASLLLPSHSC